jgi:hypothetical protein
VLDVGRLGPSTNTADVRTDLLLALGMPGEGG